MSDEEKEAIKVVNKRTERLIEELKIEEEDLIDEPKIAYLITQIEANKTLVSLIEKQSKEIEESEQKEKQAYIDGTNVADKLCNKKWEGKIKAKIEELDDLNSPFAQRVIKGKEVYLTEMVQNILQSLLEKE